MDWLKCLEKYRFVLCHFITLMRVFHYVGAILKNMSRICNWNLYFSFTFFVNSSWAKASFHNISCVLHIKHDKLRLFWCFWSVKFSSLFYIRWQWEKQFSHFHGNCRLGSTIFIFISNFSSPNILARAQFGLLFSCSLWLRSEAHAHIHAHMKWRRWYKTHIRAANIRVRVERYQQPLGGLRAIVRDFMRGRLERRMIKIYDVHLLFHPKKLTRNETKIKEKRKKCICKGSEAFRPFFHSHFHS